jgi:LL-diaminopimelate aminotransferase
MVNINSKLSLLQSNYLFPQIAKKREAYKTANPDKKVISLGIGDTTEPILPFTLSKLVEATEMMGDVDTYHGYADDGEPALKEAIANLYQSYLASSLRGAQRRGNLRFEGDEIFISDGSKPDIARLQLALGSDVKIAVQDPAYPVYIDGSILNGVTDITYLPCTAENNFFPDLEQVKNSSVIYFCSPNNPTGKVCTFSELEQLVNKTLETNSILVFDSAYASFIRDTSLPHTIYEIPGAEKCAIEVNSLSKPAGWTGIRLGWTIIPKALQFDGGEPVVNSYSRIYNTTFNGASIISQRAAVSVLSPEGIKEINQTTDYYLRNAKLIKQTLNKLGIENFGGENSSYVWADYNKDSWEAFEQLLNEYQIVTTPGSGFGPAGEGFIRFSSFQHYELVQEACDRLLQLS